MIFFLERLRANTRVIKKLETYKYINCSKFIKKKRFFRLSGVRTLFEHFRGHLDIHSAEGLPAGMVGHLLCFPGQKRTVFLHEPGKGFRGIGADPFGTGFFNDPFYSSKG